MYARYKKIRGQGGHIHYSYLEKAFLFGCNQGIIPRLLREQLPLGQEEPFLWHINISASLAATELRDSALVIDLKPKQSKSNLSLYELLDVWGYSEYDWTPILLRLAGLFIDKDPRGINRNDFYLYDQEIDSPIYEILYLEGTVKEGKLNGRWTAPPASPTNAALLWPETLRYFLACIQTCTPEIIDPSYIEKNRGKAS
jgi:hypothetical protein